jgi:hydroxymethylbilane synthase
VSVAATGAGPLVRTIRLGTRGSTLARAQAALVERDLRRVGLEVTTILVETAGDRRPPDTAWGEGAFVKELERALLDGRIDVAVHSAKDLPTDELPELAIAAYLAREDPRDALVCRERGRALDTLPRGARVGTDSPRRTAFVLARRPDLRLHPLHGNVDTRLRRLDDGETDALVLALAGLLRLGREDRVDEILSPAILPPAPGQGALAVQVRADDALVELLAALEDRPTRAAVEAERAFLRLSGGGCRAPIGALAEVAGSSLVLRAGYARADGSAVAFAEASGGLSDGPALAVRVVSELVARIGPRSSLERPRVLVTRPVERADTLVGALRERGLEPVIVPTIAIVEASGEREDAEKREHGGLTKWGADLRRAVGRIEQYDWVLVTSASGARAIARALGARRPLRVRWAAVGPATSAALAAQGLSADFVPATNDATSLAADLPLEGREHILLVRAARGTAGLVEALRARGASVDEIVAYRTVEGPEASRRLLIRALGGDGLRAAIFASGSSVRGLVRLTPPESVDAVLALPAICIGRATAEAARRAGFRTILVGADTRPETMAALAREAVESLP